MQRLDEPLARAPRRSPCPRLTCCLPHTHTRCRLQLAAVYERLYGDKGVTMVKGAKVTAFTGTDGKVRRRPVRPRG